jgi:hypothetical protein
MTKQQTKPQIKKPENFDLKEAEAAVMKLIRENKEWVKEMATK